MDEAGGGRDEASLNRSASSWKVALKKWYLMNKKSQVCEEPERVSSRQKEQHMKTLRRKSQSFRAELKAIPCSWTTKGKGQLLEKRGRMSATGWEFWHLLRILFVVQSLSRV